jgi:hypothetical protein
MAANMTHDFFFHFFIEIENFRGEGKILMWHTQLFPKKVLIFTKF